MSQHSFLTKLLCKQDSICKMKMRNSCITELCKIKLVYTLYGYTLGDPETFPKLHQPLKKATSSFINSYVGLKQNVVHGSIDLSMG